MDFAALIQQYGLAVGILAVAVFYFIVGNNRNSRVVAKFAERYTELEQTLRAELLEDKEGLEKKLSFLDSKLIELQIAVAKLMTEKTWLTTNNESLTSKIVELQGLLDTCRESSVQYRERIAALTALQSVAKGVEIATASQPESNAV